jgi:hypothetical protein
MLITRRSFAKTLAATAVATALPLRAASKLNVGIGTYSYHNLPLDQMIVQLNALSVREIEMSRGEFMLMNHPSDDLFRAAREKFDHAGIRCSSYYSATIKEEADLDNAVRFAKILGAGNITGDATGPILYQIDQRLTQERLTFGIHNHYFKGEKFAYESPEDVLAALNKLSKTVGATADIGHFVSCGHDPVAAKNFQAWSPWNTKRKPTSTKTCARTWNSPANWRREISGKFQGNFRAGTSE